MALQIGRVGIDVALDNPEVWDYDGEIVTVTGELFAATIYDAKVLRQQLLGHVNNPDEPVVPIIWSEDTLADGFYRVLDAQVGSVPGSYSAFWFPFSVTLHRVADYAVPLFESRLLAPPDVRANVHVVDGIDWHGIIGEAINEDFYSVGIPIGQGDSVDSEEGEMVQVTDSATVDMDLSDTIARWRVPPASYYKGACRVELDYANNGTFRKVVGRQIPNLPDRWRIGNGIIQITDERANSFEWTIGVARWKAGAPGSYTTPKNFDIGFPTGPTQPPVSITVLRNSPEEVVVRFVKGVGGVARITYDLTLKRGVPWFELRPSADWLAPDLDEFTILLETSEVNEALKIPTAFPGLDGRRAAGVDADGLVFALATTSEPTWIASPAGLRLAAVEQSTSFVVALAEIDSTGTGYPAADTPEKLVLEYFRGMSETVRLVQP